eukprot:5894730-Pyramimonas_sp.AAC.1
MWQRRTAAETERAISVTHECDRKCLLTRLLTRVCWLAVAATLNVSPAVVAAGITVDNVFGLLYFPLVSSLATLPGGGGDTPPQGAKSLSGGAAEG